MPGYGDNHGPEDDTLVNPALALKLEQFGISLLAAEAPAFDSAGLSVERYTQVMDAARELSAAWRPARQGASFAWRDVTEHGSMDFPLQRAHGALATLSGTVALNGQLAESTGLTRPSDALALAALLDHLAARPAAVPGDWLTTDQFARIDEAITRLDALLAAITAAAAEAARAAGATWQAIPQPDRLPDLPGAGAIFPPAPDVSGARADEITALASRFRDRAGLLVNRAAALASLAGMLGLRPPVTFGEASDAVSLARLAELSLHPERQWLTQDGYTSALGAVDALRAAADTLAATEEVALLYYTPQALNEDAASLRARLGAHEGLGKLSAEYRADKKTLAAFTVPGIGSDVALRRLGLFVTWQNAARSYTAAEQAHARALGGHYAGRGTDFAAVAQALGVAETVLRLARGQDTSRIADYLAGPKDTPLLTTVGAIAGDLQSWQSDRTTPPELAGGAIADAITWLCAQGELLETTATVTRTVSDAVGQPLTAGEARALLAVRAAADAAHGRLAASAGDFDDIFGGLYCGPQTDMPALRNARQWAARLRELVGGNAAVPLTEVQAKVTATARTTSGLGKSAARWLEARDSLLAAFDQVRRSELSADLDDYAEADNLIKTLRQDTAGQHEWHAYRRARTVLETYGMGSAVAFCVTQRVPADQVPAVTERALLQGWTD